LNDFIASLEHLRSPQDFTGPKNSEVLKSYLLKALKGFNDDPPDTDYQRGYLGALRALFEDLCMTGDELMQHRILETAAINNIMS
jgi:hypothetical protein